MPRASSLNQTLRKERSTGPRRGLSCHRQSCDGDDGSSDVDWELSGVWKLDSHTPCKSAFLDATPLETEEVLLTDDFGTFIVEQQGNTGRIYQTRPYSERTTLVRR